MARRREKSYDPADDLPIRGAKLEPIRVVERELTRPDGTTLKVKVPVYPPFRLETMPPEAKDSSSGQKDDKREKSARKE